MTPTEIRTELLRQHATIRAKSQRASEVVDRWCHGESSREEVRAHLVALTDAVRMHNLREEELLRGVLPGVDAWGKARAEIMDEEHVMEHEELYTTLVEAAGLADPKATRTLTHALINHLHEHMLREESTLLGEDVLRDDV